MGTDRLFLAGQLKTCCLCLVVASPCKPWGLSLTSHATDGLTQTYLFKTSVACRGQRDFINCSTQNMPSTPGCGVTEKALLGAMLAKSYNILGFEMNPSCEELRELFLLFVQRVDTGYPSCSSVCLAVFTSCLVKLFTPKVHANDLT